MALCQARYQINISHHSKMFETIVPSLVCGTEVENDEVLGVNWRRNIDSCWNPFKFELMWCASQRRSHLTNRSVFFITDGLANVSSSLQ